MIHSKKLKVFFLLFSLFFCKIHAQTFNLLKDINQTSIFPNDGFASNFINVGSQTVFRGWDPETGDELWVSDGTVTGTKMIKDINPGTASSYPRTFIRSGNTVYFLARNTENGLAYEGLWKSDGTENGTVLIKNFRYFIGGGFFGETMVPFNNELYFTYNDSIHGLELWKSNGTEAGTMLVKDIEPGSERSDIADLVVLNGKLVFKRRSNTFKSGIWQSDGTENGTVEIMNQSSIQYQSPFNVSNTIFNGFLFYFIEKNTETTLWKTDGTTAGTVQVKKLDNGGARGEILTVLGDQLLFAFSNSLGVKSIWKTDGTEAGTTEISKVEIAEVMYGDTKSYAVVGNTLYFSAKTAQNGVELWKTSGTAGSTLMVKDIAPGTASAQPRNFVVVNGKLLFTANDAVHGNELWLSDGTNAGTVLFHDFNTGGESSNPLYAGTETQQLLISCLINTTKQTQFWITDGSIPGTSFLKEMRSGTANSIGLYFNWINANNRLFMFPANNGVTGLELWRTDGTETGTYILPEIFPGNNELGTYINLLTNINDKTLFQVSGPYTRNELWAISGEANNTNKIKDLILSSAQINAAGNFALLGAANSSGYELWITDGTEAGTIMLKDINTAAYASSYPNQFTYSNGVTFFAATDSSNYRNLWKTNGTANGTVRVKKIKQTESLTTTGIGENGESLFVDVNGTLFFTANDGLHGMELWKSDGTESGTFMIKDIFKGPTNIITDTIPRFLTNVNGTLYFVAVDSTNGESLWKSDGTEAGTIPIKSFGKPWIRNIGNLVNVNGVLLFTAKTEANGTELWTSNGTSNGTIMIKDIAPGPFSGFHSMGIVADGHLYFSANDRIYGDEIWKSDGTEAGTVMVQNISLSGGCNPSIIGKMGNRIFATVSTNNYGREIWVAQVGTTTNISGTNNLNLLRVYPNPANIQTVIEFPALTKSTSWQLYNANGHLFQSGIAKPGLAKLVIDLSCFPKGLYLFTMKDAQSRNVVKKIIKQ